MTSENTGQRDQESIRKDEERMFEVIKDRNRDPTGGKDEVKNRERDCFGDS